MRLDFVLALALSMAAVACGGDDDDDGDSADDGASDADASVDAGDTSPDAGDGGEADAAPGQDGGMAGDKCGGATDLKCDDLHVCDWEDDSCGGDGSTGRCVPRPTECEPIKPQVCGCDGNAYENACEAHRNGTDAAQLGICLPGS